MLRTKLARGLLFAGAGLGLLSLLLPAALDSGQQVMMGWEACRVSLFTIFGLGSCVPCWVISFAALSNGLFIVAPFLAMMRVSRSVLRWFGIVSVLALVAGIATPILASMDSSVSITPLAGYYVWLLCYIALIAASVHDLWRGQVPD